MRRLVLIGCVLAMVCGVAWLSDPPASGRDMTSREMKLATGGEEIVDAFCTVYCNPALNETCDWYNSITPVGSAQFACHNALDEEHYDIHIWKCVPWEGIGHNCENVGGDTGTCMFKVSCKWNVADEICEQNSSHSYVHGPTLCNFTY